MREERNRKEKERDSECGEGCVRASVCSPGCVCVYVYVFVCATVCVQRVVCLCVQRFVLLNVCACMFVCLCVCERAKARDKRESTRESGREERIRSARLGSREQKHT